MDRNATGLWDATTRAEASASVELREHLNVLDEAMGCCYEAAVTAAVARAKVDESPGVAVAGLFLKKALTDLRAASILLRVGYTSPAAGVVASLWENALTTAVLVNSKKAFEALSAERDGDVPWRPRELAALMARCRCREEDGAVDSEKIELELYAQYKWLCKIKHPTLRSAMHDAFGADMGDGRFVVMALPDVRPEDRSMKSLITLIAVARVADAAMAFLGSKLGGVDADERADAGALLDELQELMKPVVENLSATPLPYHIGDTREASIYKAKRASSEPSASD